MKKDDHPQWEKVRIEDHRIRHGLRAQLRRYHELLAAGAKRVGWKIALNDRPTQRRLRIDTCVTGYLTAGTVLQPDQPHSLQGSTLVGVEPEVAIFLRNGVPGNAGTDAIWAAIEGLGCAAEIIDVKGRFDHLERVIEENIFHRAVIFGSRGPEGSRVDLDDVLAHAGRDGGSAPPIPAARVLGSLAELVRFAAQSLELCGEKLEPGDRIISGSLTPIPVWVKTGDKVKVDLGRLGSVQVSFKA